MKTIDAGAGLAWIREGVALFRIRPFLLTNVFIACFFFMTIIGAFPLIGSALPPLLAPVFSVFFLHVIHDVREQRPFDYSHLFALFRTPVVFRLMTLGALYFFAAVAAVYASSHVDGGVFMRLMGGEQMEMETLQVAAVRQAVFLFVFLILLSQFCFWFVAPLIAWKDMPVGQSLFYNFFTILRIWKAFFVYLLGLFMACFITPMMISTFIMLLLGRNIGLLVTFSLMMMVAVLVYCSFYSMFVSLFGGPSSEGVSFD